MAQSTTFIHRESFFILNWFIVFFILANQTSAQQTDTLTVYFKSGESKISKAQLKRIEAIPRVIYTNNIDSVHFIGMADSVGSINANLILGKKRADEVSKIVKPFLQTQPAYKIFSHGEQSGDAVQSRRVDVVFFSPEPKKDSVLRDLLYKGPNRCLKRADTLLHRSHIYSESRRRRGRNVTIETNYINLVNDSIYYCAKRLKNSVKGDSLVIYPIKWNKGKTYGIGEKKRDLYAVIDKKDFDEFEVFTVDTGDCQECAFLEFDYADVYRSALTKCRMADRFLMSHLEVKRKRLDNHLVTVRVPRTYVNLYERYYVGYSNNSPLKWREFAAKGGLGKLFAKLFNRNINGKCSNYYYTDLPVAWNKCLQNVFRDMKCCVEEPDDPGEYEPICAPHYIKCGTMWIGAKRHPYFGVSYTRVDENNLIVPHIGVERMMNSGLRYDFQIGISQFSKLVFQGSMGFDFLTIPKYVFGGLSQWTSITDVARVKGFYSIFLGSSLCSFKNNEKISHFNQFTYIGMTYYSLNTSSFTKPYIQFGFRHDYLQDRSFALYPQVEIGVRWGWRE